MTDCVKLKQFNIQSDVVKYQTSVAFPSTCYVTQFIHIENDSSNECRNDRNASVIPLC